MGQGISVSLIQPAGTRGGMVKEAPKMIQTLRSTMTEEQKVDFVWSRSTSKWHTRGKLFKLRQPPLLCNLLVQINLLCLIWKLGMSPFICHMVAWSAPTGCRVTDQNVEGCWLTQAHQEGMLKSGVLDLAETTSIYWKSSKFLYP